MEGRSPRGPRRGPAQVAGTQDPGGAGSRGAPAGWAGGRGCRTQASSGLGGGDVALTRRPSRAAWSRGTWPLLAAPGTQTRGQVRGARAADSGARLGSPGMPGPGALGGDESGRWEGLQGGRPRNPLLGEWPPGGPGPPRPSLGGAPPRPRDPPSPRPLAGPGVPRLFSPPQKLSRTSPLLRRSNQPPGARPCRLPRPSPPPAC